MNRKAFTLLELLVSVAILGMLVVALAVMFKQSTRSWESGHTRAEAQLIGRAICDFVTKDAALAIYKPGHEIPSMSGFWTLVGTNRMEQFISYHSNAQGVYRTVEGYAANVPLMENSDDCTVSLSLNFVPANDPVRADVTVAVTLQKYGRTEPRPYVYKGTAALMNRNRYRL